MAKLGFIGLGIMGAPMAGHLQAGGHKLYLHDVKNPPASLVEGGAPALHFYPLNLSKPTLNVLDNLR